METRSDGNGPLDAPASPVQSNSDGSFDCRPRIIALKGEILVAVLKDRVGFSQNIERREGARLARELKRASWLFGGGVLR